MRQAVAGDEGALTLLLAELDERLCARVQRKIPSALRSRFGAEDIVQETHREVFRHIRTFEPRGPDAFERWVSTIAVRKLRDVIKGQRRAKRGGGRTAASPAGPNVDDSMIGLLDVLAGPGRTPSRCVARVEALRAVQSALDLLPEHYRQAILLVRIEGRPVAEVAAEMGRTERAVHGLTRRGLELLRDRLGDSSAYLSSSG